MAGELGSALADLKGEGTTPAAAGDPQTSAPNSSNGQTEASTKVPAHLALGSYGSSGPLILMPAGIVGDIVGSLGSTIGGELGGWFGDRALGKTLGGAAGELIKGLSPWSVVPPYVAPQSSGPASNAPTSEEALVVVPAGFLTGLLGGVGGKLLGGAIGGLFGNKNLGSNIGSAAGGALGSFFGPFDVVPPQNLNPQTAGPTANPDEAMVLVPAGWLGHLFGGVARGVGQLAGGGTASSIANVVGDLAEKFVPWGVVPPGLVPASAGPAGDQQSEDLVLVPASWFGSIAKTFGGTIGRGIGGWFGNANAGQQIGDAAGNLIDAIPFSVIPQNLQPADIAGGGGNEEDKLVLVPAGIIGGLLGSLGGVFGDAVGGLFGNAKLGRQIGDFAGGVAKEVIPWSLEPFATVPASHVR